MAVFSGRVIGTLILGHFLTTRAGSAGPRIRARMHHALRCRAHPPLGAGYGLGSDRGSPNHGSTLFSKRAMAEIRPPVSVRTWRPTP